MSVGERPRQFSLSQYYGTAKRARLLDRLILFLLVLTIFVAPLPFGSIGPGGLFVLQITAAVCFLLWMLKLVLCGVPAEVRHFAEWHRTAKEAYRRTPFFHRHPRLAEAFLAISLGRWPRKNVSESVMVGQEPLTPIKPPFYSFLGYPVRNTGLEGPALVWFAWLLIQMLPLPYFAVRIISPQAALLYETAGEAAGKDIWFHPLSLDAFATFANMMEHAAYFVLFLVIVNASPQYRYFRAVLIALVLALAFQSIYGLFEFLSGHQHIFAYAKKVYRDVASGTFVNRNHFAAYLGLILPMLLTLIGGRANGFVDRSGSWGIRMIRYFEISGGRHALFVFLILLASSGIVLSLSRSGILFSVITCTAYFALFAVVRGKVSRWIFVALGLAGFGMLVFWPFLEPVLHRFVRLPDEFGIAERSRLQVYLDTFTIFRQFPLTGSGAGTFSQVFPMFRSFPTDTIYSWAHNDYLQFMAEAGMAAVLLIAICFWKAFERLQQVISRPLTQTVIIQIGGFCGWLALALHSLTNFAFHVPAIAVTGVVMAAVFWGDTRAKRII